MAKNIPTFFGFDPRTQFARFQILAFDSTSHFLQYSTVLRKKHNSSGPPQNLFFFFFLLLLLLFLLFLLLLRLSYKVNPHPESSSHHPYPPSTPTLSIFMSDPPDHLERWCRPSGNKSPSCCPYTSNLVFPPRDDGWDDDVEFLGGVFYDGFGEEKTGSFSTITQKNTSW